MLFYEVSTEDLNTPLSSLSTSKPSLDYFTQTQITRWSTTNSYPIGGPFLESPIIKRIGKLMLFIFNVEVF